MVHLGRPNPPSLLEESAAGEGGQDTKTDSNTNREEMNRGFFAVFDGHAGNEVAKFCQVLFA